MLAGLAPIMDLAAASGESLGDVSDIVTDALTAFGLEADDAAHFSDVLAATATSANTNVGMMGYTFQQVAPIAGALGYEVDDVSVAIGLMANAGIKGEKAGTQLRAVLTNLAKPTDEMAIAMDALGLSLTDSSGEMLPFDALLGNLRTSFSGLSAEEKAMYAATLAGKEGMAGLLAIVNASDEDIDKLTTAIENCDGATRTMRDIILDTAEGDITLFKSAVEGLEVTLWGLVEGSFRSVVQTATGWVDAFRNMDSATQMAVMKVGALAAAAGPVMIAGAKIIKGIGKLIPALEALMSPMGIITGGLALFAVAAVDANNDIGKTFTKMASKVKTSLETVNKQITAKMKTVSDRMPALCQSIVDGLHDIIPEGMNTISLVLEGFMDAIGDNAANIAEIGKTIITDFLGGVSSAAPKLIPAVASMMTNIVTAIIDSVPAIVTAAGEVVKALADGIQSTDWVGLGTKISNSLTTALTSITGTVETLFNEMLSATAAQDWSAIGTQIIDLILTTVTSTATTVGTFISNLVTSIGNYSGWASLGSQFATIAEHLITGIADAIPTLTGVAVQIIDAISGVLSGQGAESMLTGFESLATSILDGLAAAIPKVAESASSIVTAVANLLNGLDWTKATETISSIGESIINLIVAGIEGASDVAVTIIDAIASMFSEEGLATKLVTSAGKIATTLITAIADAIPKVTGAAVNIINKIGELISGDGTDAFATSVTTVAKSLIDGIVAAIPKVENAAISLLNAIGGLLTGDGTSNLIDSFTTIATSIINGIVDAIPTVANAAVNIIGALNTILGGDKTEGLKTSLTNLATSIIGGIVDAIPDVANAAVNIVNAIGSLFSEDGAGTAILDGALGIATAIINGVIDAIPSVTDAAVNIINAIGSLFSVDGEGTAFRDQAFDIAKSLINSIVAALPTLTDSAKLIISAIGDALVDYDWSGFAENLTSLGKTLFNALVEGIKAVDDVGTAIIEEVGNALGRINWDGVTVSLTGFTDMLFNGIITGLGALETMSSDFISAFATVMEKIDWPAATDSAIAIAQTIIDGIIDGLGKMTEVSTSLADNLATVIKRIPWGTLTTATFDLATSLIDGIIEGLKTLTPDMIELINAIVRGIGTAAEGLATAAATIVGKLVAYLIDPDGMAQIADAGLMLVGEFARGLLDLGGTLIETAASGLVNGLTNATVGFFRGLFGVKVNEAVEQALNEFSEMQFTVPTDRFDGMGQACGLALYEAMSATLSNSEKLEDAITAWSIVVQNGYAALMPEFEFLGNESFQALARGMVTSIETEEPDIELAAQQAALLIATGYSGELATVLYDKEPEIYDAMSAMLDGNIISLEELARQNGYDIGELMGIALPEGYSFALDSGKLIITDATNDIIATANASLQDGWTVGDTMSVLWDAVFNTTLADIGAWEDDLEAVLSSMGVDAGSLLGVALPEGIAEGLKNGTLSVEDAAEAIVDAAKATDEQIAAAKSSNESGGQTAGEGMETGIENATPGATTASEELAGAVEDGVSGLPEELKNTTDTAMLGIQTAILSGQSPAETAAANVSDAVVQQFIMTMTYDNGYAIGNNYTGGLKDAIEGAQASIVSAAQYIANSALQIASSVLSYSAGQTIGTQFDNGIVRGIQAGASAIKSAARSAALSALSAAKASLGINSPSKLARDVIGLGYDEGIVVGLEKGMGSIQKAAAEVSRGLHESFYVGDTSRGTVYTSQQQAVENARKTAEANNAQSMLERAETLGRAIADRLIESGALNSDIYMDEDKVGQKVARPVSATISRKAKETVAGRSLQGVLA